MILKSEERIKQINTKLAWLAQYVKFSNQQGMTDINKAVEDFFCGLLNIIFDASLENMNYIQRDYPAVDLGDEDNRLAVQVTSTSSREKIVYTLDKFFENRLDKHYNRLIILIVGKKEAYRKKFPLQWNFNFNKDSDIWDIDQLGKEISELEDEAQEAVLRYLDDQMQLPWEDYRKTAAAAEAAAKAAPVRVSGEKKLKNSLPVTLGANGFNAKGRKKELDLLAQAFERVENPIFITGLGGMGKTELAIYFGQEQQKGHLVHFVRFSGTFKDTVTLGIAKGVENLWQNESNPEYTYNEVMRVLKGCDRNTILIIDNADPADGNFASLEDETYRKLCGMDLRLIITTRAPVYGGVKVEPMDPERLLEIMGKYVQYPEEELLPLIEAVGRHTQTVDLMARTLDESCDDVTPTMLLAAVKNSTLPEEDYPEVTTDHNRVPEQLHIYAHLRSLFNVVQLDEDSRIALSCATLLPEGGMETTLFRHSLPAGAQKAYRSLEKRGFLSRAAGMTAIHPVIRLVAGRELKPNDETCRTFLENLWGNYNKKSYDHDRYSAMAELYTTAAEMLENGRGGWSGRARALWNKIGQYEKAKSCAGMTIHRREAALPADHPDLADAYNDMGLAYQGLRDHRGMAEYFGKALEIRRLVLAEEHVDLAKSYNNVGEAHEAQGDYQTALTYKLKAMEIFEKILPADDLDLATSYNNVGVAYGKMGDHRKELEYEEKALEIRKQVLPPDHPDLAKSYNNAGATYGDLGDHRKALEYQKKALGIREKVLPPDHPDLAHTYFWMGYTYGELRNDSLALEYLEKALRIREARLPPGHPHTKITRDWIAYYKRKLERPSWMSQIQ